MKKEQLYPPQIKGKKKFARILVQKIEKAKLIFF